MLEELDVSNNVLRRYTYGLERISQHDASGAHYYGYDGQGNVRFLTDSAGAVTDTYDYDAYGNLISRTGTTANNYLYQGEQFDPDLGLYYLRARYYNQETGRFWTADSFAGFHDEPHGMNKYAYANANPAGNHDPSGHWSFTVLGIQQDFALWQDVRKRVRDTWSAPDEFNGIYGPINGGSSALAAERRAPEQVMTGWIGAEDGYVVGDVMGNGVTPQRSDSAGNPVEGGGPGDHFFFSVNTGGAVMSRVERNAERAQVAMNNLWTRLTGNSPGDELNYWLESHWHSVIFKALQIGSDPMNEEYGLEIYPSYTHKGPTVRSADNGWAPSASAMRLLRPKHAAAPNESFHSAMQDRKIKAYSEFAIWNPEETAKFQRLVAPFLIAHQAYYGLLAGAGGALVGAVELGEMGVGMVQEAISTGDIGKLNVPARIGAFAGEVFTGGGDDLYGESYNFGQTGNVANCADAMICFTAGTKVLVENTASASHGLKNIEEIKPGDRVWSRCDKTGELGYKPVVATFVTNPVELVHLTYRHSARESHGSAGCREVAACTEAGESSDGEGESALYELTGTTVHPFWSADRNAWIVMGELKPGERLLLSSGVCAIVETIEHETAPEGEHFTTYNFEVEDWHTYFVAGKGETSTADAEGVWVHNKTRINLLCELAAEYKKGSTAPIKAAKSATLSRAKVGASRKPGGYRTGDTDTHNLLSVGVNRAPGHGNIREDGFVQSHHGIQKQWAKRKYTNYDENAAPAMLLRSRSGEVHAKLSAAQRARRSIPGGWDSSIRTEFNISYREMIDAGLSPREAQRVIKQNYKYFDSIGAFE